MASLGALWVSIGCTVVSGSTETSTWEEPSWMAPARQAVHDYQTAMSECLESFGVEARPAPGSVVFARAASMASFEEMNAAVTECSARVSEPVHWHLPLDDSAFYRMLDTRACLIAHGQEVSEPPSRELWLSSESPWNPWREVADFSRTSDEEVSELMEFCPQDGGSGIDSRIPSS